MGMPERAIHFASDAPAPSKFQEIEWQTQRTHGWNSASNTNRQMALGVPDWRQGEPIWDRE